MRGRTPHLFTGTNATSSQNKCAVILGVFRLRTGRVVLGGGRDLPKYTSTIQCPKLESRSAQPMRHPAVDAVGRKLDTYKASGTAPMCIWNGKFPRKRPPSGSPLPPSPLPSFRKHMPQGGGHILYCNIRRIWKKYFSPIIFTLCRPHRKAHVRHSPPSPPQVCTGHHPRAARGPPAEPAQRRGVGGGRRVRADCGGASLRRGRPFPRAGPRRRPRALGRGPILPAVHVSGALPGPGLPRHAGRGGVPPSGLVRGGLCGGCGADGGRRWGGGGQWE